jgi:hypothetical protein
VSAPTWIRGKRQLLDTTGKNLVASCVSLSTSSFNFSTYFPHLSFLVFVLGYLLVCFLSCLGCLISPSVIFAKETFVSVL